MTAALRYPLAAANGAWTEECLATGRRLFLNPSARRALPAPSCLGGLLVSSPKLTCRTRPLSVSRASAPVLRSEMFMPCLLHDRTPRGHDLEYDSKLAGTAIVRLGERDGWCARGSPRIFRSAVASGQIR